MVPQPEKAIGKMANTMSWLTEANYCYFSTQATDRQFPAVKATTVDAVELVCGASGIGRSFAELVISDLESL